MLNQEDRISLLRKIAPRSPKLELKVVSSAYLAKGALLSIDACGVEGSRRGQKDGFTYFGCKKNVYSGMDEGTGGSERTKIIANDFVIPAK